MADVTIIMSILPHFSALVLFFIVTHCDCLSWLYKLVLIFCIIIVLNCGHVCSILFHHHFSFFLDHIQYLFLLQSTLSDLSFNKAVLSCFDKIQRPIRSTRFDEVDLAADAKGPL